MPDCVSRHLTRLRRAAVAMLGGIVVLTSTVAAVEPPDRLRMVQAGALLWPLVAFAALNLITVMPAYRAMLAGPRRVFAVNQDASPLLAAHGTAHLVALARVAGTVLLGVVLFAATGVRTWAWTFTGVAAVGWLLLWPSRRKVAALLDASHRPT